MVQRKCAGMSTQYEDWIEAKEAKRVEAFYRARAVGKGSWYFTTVFECPLCGRSTEYRERRWTPKPDTPQERYEWIQDACGDHFL